MKPLFRVKIDFDNIRIIDEEVSDVEDVESCINKIKRKVG